MPAIFRRDQHLSSPIDQEELKYACFCKERRSKKIKTRMKKEHISLFRRYKVRDVREGLKGSFQAYMIGKVDSQQAPTRSKTTQGVSITRGILVAYKALLISFGCLFQNTNYGAELPFKPSDILTDKIVNLYHWRELLEGALDGVTASTKLYRKRRIKQHKFEFFGNLMVYTNVDTRRRYFCTYNEYLAVLSSITAQFYSLVYCKLADKCNKYNHSLYDEYREFQTAAIKDVVKYKNDAHDVLKALPSLAIAQINAQFDKHVNGERFKNNMLDDMGLMRDSNLVRFFTKELRDDQDVHIRLELSGLYKSFGYPIIDVEETISYFHDYATKQPDSIDLSFCNRLRNAFKKYFIKQYFKENDVFPPVTYTGPVNDSIKDSIKSSSWNESLYASWDVSLFENIRIDKCVDFDYHEDEGSLLSDKSISSGRSYWYEEFDEDALFNFWGFKAPKRSKKSRRLLVNYVTEKEVKVKDTIQEIEDNGGLDLEDCIMIGVEKEKENKISGRVFGKTTRKARQYQTCTEWNLGHNLFKYMKNQSMNMTDKEFRTTLNNMNKPFSTLETKKVFISFDFKKWCLTFTHEATSPIFEVIDPIFGLRGVYAYSHIFCQQALYMFQSRWFPPPIDDDGMPKPTKGSIYSMNKWLEGMRQKGWTIITSTLIEMTANHLNTKAQLMGQGDNQVICLELPSSATLQAIDTSIDDYAMNFIKHLEESAAKIGLTLKPSETWASTNLFEYSKKYFYKGTEVSSALKTASRLGSVSNNDFNTTSNGIAGAFSSGVTIASTDSSPLPAYFLSCVEATRVLDKKNRKHLLSQDETTAVLLLNRNVGLYPTVLFSSFCVRGMLDPLSSCISLMRYSYAYYPEIYEVMSKVVNFSPHNADPLLIIKDPQALAINVPRSPEGLIRQILRNGLESVTRNEGIKPLFSVNTKIDERRLVSDLYSITPTNPKVMNALYKNSNVCIRDKLINRFSVSRSVRELLRRVVDISDTEFRDIIDRIDSQMYMFYTKRIKSNKFVDFEELFMYPPDITCAYEIALHLRAHTWGRKIEGVTMPAIEEQVNLEHWGDIDPTREGYSFSVKVDKSVTTHNRGSHDPYIGSQTGKKTARSTLSVVENSSMTQSIQEILQLGPWMIAPGEEYLADLLRVLYEEKTSIKIDEMEGLTQNVVGGSLTHRLRCDAIKFNTFWNGLSVFNTHCFINTDIMFQIARSFVDYTLCMQSVMLISLSRLSILHTLGFDIVGNHACTLECPTCTVEIPNEQHRMSNPPEYQGVVLPNYVRELTVKTKQHQLPDEYTTDKQFSYSTHIAWKWAKFFYRSHHGSLESQPINTTRGIVPSFCNLSEFSRVNVRTFFRTFAASLLLLSQHEHVYIEFVEDLMFFDSLEVIKSLYVTICKCNLQGLTNDELRGSTRSQVGFQTALCGYLAKNTKDNDQNTCFNGYFNLTPYQVESLRIQATKITEERRYTLSPCVVGLETDASIQVRKYKRPASDPRGSKRRLDLDFVPQDGNKRHFKKIKKCHYTSSLEFDGDGSLGITSLRYFDTDICMDYVVSIGDDDGIYPKQLIDLGYHIKRVTVIPEKDKDYLSQTHEHPSHIKEVMDDYKITQDQILAWSDGVVPKNADLYIVKRHTDVNKVPHGMLMLALITEGAYNIDLISDLNVYAYPARWVLGRRSAGPHYFTISKSLSELLSFSCSTSILKCINNSNVEITSMDIVNNAMVKYFGEVYSTQTFNSIIKYRYDMISEAISTMTIDKLTPKRARHLIFTTKTKQIRKLLKKLSNIIAIISTLYHRKIRIPPRLHVHTQQSRTLHVCTLQHCTYKTCEIRGDISMRSLNGFWLLSQVETIEQPFINFKKRYIMSSIEVLDDFGYDPYILDGITREQMGGLNVDDYLNKVFDDWELFV